MTRWAQISKQQRVAAITPTVGRNAKEINLIFLFRKCLSPLRTGVLGEGFSSVNKNRDDAVPKTYTDERYIEVQLRRPRKIIN